MKRFSDLTEQEILALAISLEEETRASMPTLPRASRAITPPKVFAEMSHEEDTHRRRLIELHRKKFGEHIPLLRRQDVRGFVSRRPLWMVRPLGLDKVRKQAEVMELETQRFYEQAMARTSDASVRKLLGDLARAERGHEAIAEHLEEKILDRGARKNFRLATTITFLVVAIELWVIVWIRSRYMDTPFLQATFEVVLGGVIVFAAGILIGSA
jgi:rubrerythrin